MTVTNGFITLQKEEELTFYSSKYDSYQKIVLISENSWSVRMKNWPTNQDHFFPLKIWDLHIPNFFKSQIQGHHFIWGWK
jgi:hypothetical protein